MARYKQIDMSPRFLAVDLSRQILPGSFEFALTHLLDRLSLRAFEARFRNDAVGAPAYPPAVLLNRAVGLQQGHHTQPRHRSGLSRERGVRWPSRAIVIRTSPPLRTL